MMQCGAILGWLLMTVHISHQAMVTVATEQMQADVPESSYSPASENSKTTPNIRSLHVISEVKYRYATTLVSSRVVNPSNQSGEASFTLTLPESAFISEFLMEVGGKVYKAYVKEKEEAKATYDQAVAAGQFAGHAALDARDSNQFTVSVNIEAHGKVTFNLTYEQLLKRNLGKYSNVININPRQIVEDMSVTVNIEEPTAIKDLEVPDIQISNEVAPEKAKPNPLANIEEMSPQHKVVTWNPSSKDQKNINSTGVSGQFMVSYDVDRETSPQQILVDEGYFVHFFAPEDLPKLKKHVVFVLDYSGSMGGRKLEQLKEAMNKILADLAPTDFFSIVVFQSYIEAWSPKKGYTTSTGALSSWETKNIPQAYLNTTLDKDFAVPASPENIALARSYIGAYNDLGATNIIGGLRTGLELVNIGAEQWVNESDPPQSVIIFLTDGQPNVEETDPEKITEKISALNTKKCPIFSLGFGYGADLSFLRRLSLSNNGFARNIYEAADAAQQLENFYKTIASPLLSNITFSYLPGQVESSSKTKVSFPVFFRGSELVVAGKLTRSLCEDNTEVPLGEFSGTTATGNQKYPISFSCLTNYTDRSYASHLEKTWAYLSIQQLLDKADSLTGAEEKNQTKDQALKLALQYSFVTPLTSLVVVKPNETESAVDTTKVQPGMAVPYSAGYGGGSAMHTKLASYPMPMPMAPGGYPAAFEAPGSMVPSDLSYGGHSDIHLNLEVEEKGNASTGTKVALTEITWLQPLLADSGNVSVAVNGSQLFLGLDEPDQDFGTCSVDNKPGTCHHFKYCALDIFKNDVLEFLPYQCSIPSSFLGVCCPTESEPTMAQAV